MSLHLYNRLCSTLTVLGQVWVVFDRCSTVHSTHCPKSPFFSKNQGSESTTREMVTYVVWVELMQVCNTVLRFFKLNSSKKSISMIFG